MNQEQLRYTKSHEWIGMDGDTAVVGITDFAQSELGELTFVELPSPGDHVEADAEVAVVESVKAASDIYAPASGTIAAVNEQLDQHPETVNSDPFGEGWLFKMTLDRPEELDALMDASTYEETLPDE